MPCASTCVYLARRYTGVVSSVKRALAAESVDEVADVMAEDRTASLIFEQCLRPALFGHWTEVRLLVGTWHEGVLELLHSASTTQDVKFEGEDTSRQNTRREVR